MEEFAMKKKILAAAVAAMFLGSSFPAYAAPQYMADGAIFDAEWYLQQNPDVAAAYPGATPDVLYQHYATCGANEGRTPYNAAAFNPAAVLPYAGQTSETTATPVPPSMTPAVSNNKDEQNYRWYSNYNWNWASPITSYLYKNNLGGLTRVEYIDKSQLVVEDYDGSFYLRSSRNIPMELPLWGGFYAGEKYNFVIFGQENMQEDDSAEVVRVVKYSKDWQRLGQANLCGADTTTPFDAGSVRFAEYGDYLYIRTCHEMYKSSDGKNHQSNMTLVVRQSDMAIKSPSYGYASHSFNQFIIIDKERDFVTLDHGDAYPRSIVIMRSTKDKAGSGELSGSIGGVSESNLLTFPGKTGDNATGASIGGFAETANGYVTAFNYDGQGGQGNSNGRAVYIGYTSKDGLKSKATPITAPGMSTPILVPTGLDGGYIMWTDSNGVFYYAKYTDGGAIGTIGAADAALSDCQPILHNGEIVWYVTTKYGVNPTFTFYRMNPVTGIVTKTGANGQQ